MPVFVLAVFAVDDLGRTLLISGLVFVALLTLLLGIALARYGALWLQAYMCGTSVGMMSLIGMSLRQVKPSMIVTAKIMAKQAGLNIDSQHGMSTANFEAHALAGGDVLQVLQAIIAADSANIDLDFDRAAAIDLAGRDVLDAVRTSVSPKVIDCPNPKSNEKKTLTAVAKNGVELRVVVRVTVRTNLVQLIGGATEKTIIARVGQGIIAAIGAAETHMKVMEMPDRISERVLARGLDTNTAFEIVSIDIVAIEIGDNIGARLQCDQAEADTRIARSNAEVRRAVAVAREQEMKAKLTQNRAALVLAEAEIPAAIAFAFRAGHVHPFGNNRKRPTDNQERHRRERDPHPEVAIPDRNANPKQPRE